MQKYWGLHNDQKSDINKMCDLWPMSDEVSDSDVTEARSVGQSIMEDICNELFGLGSSAAAPQASAESSAGDAASSGQQQQNEDFFKTLSFYDDDDPLDLPFESLFDANNVPTEFSQQPNQAPISNQQINQKQNQQPVLPQQGQPQNLNMRAQGSNNPWFSNAAFFT